MRAPLPIRELLREKFNIDTVTNQTVNQLKGVELEEFFKRCRFFTSYGFNLEELYKTNPNITTELLKIPAKQLFQAYQEAKLHRNNEDLKREPYLLIDITRKMFGAY